MSSMSAGSNDPSRRALLKKGAAVAGVAWTAPVVLSWTDPVAAAVGSGGGFYTYCFDDAGDPEGWTMNGLWNISSSRSLSPSFSLHYGRGTGSNYATGNNRNFGSATSPSFVVPTTGSTLVEFDVWREVESYPSGNWDQLQLSILPSGTTLYSVARDGGTGGLWEHITVDIGGFAGTTAQLVFTFDTFDGNFNNFEGIYIDNIVVPGATPPGGGSLSASPLTQSLRADSVWMPDVAEPTPIEVRRREREARSARTAADLIDSTEDQPAIRKR